MTSATSATCSHCGLTKTASEFYPNAAKRNGLHSWCKSCVKEAGGRRRTRKSPHSQSIQTALKRRDALSFSRHTCEHISWYVQRKITEFEAATNMEAPPHVQAILGVARSLTEQHPPAERNQGHGTWRLNCHECGVTFDSRSPTRQYCDKCRVERAAVQRREYRKRPEVAALRQAQKKRQSQRDKNKPPAPHTCQICGETFMAQKKAHNPRQYCDRCHETGVVNLLRKNARLELRTINCKQCGQEIVAATAQRKYCETCQKERAREARKAWKSKQKTRFLSGVSR